MMEKKLLNTGYEQNPPCRPGASEARMRAFRSLCTFHLGAEHAEIRQNLVINFVHCHNTFLYVLLYEKVNKSYEDELL
jgi:hypothetical protein